MNKKDRIKFWHRELLKNGTITQEYYREPDKNYPPYRKGSYFIAFSNENICISCGNVNKYKAYQNLYRELKKYH